MAIQITETQIISWLHRLTHFAVWLLVAVLHSILLGILVACLVLFGVTGSDIHNYVQAAGSHLGLESAWQALSFFGVSGFAILSAYAVAMKRILMKISLRYILKRGG